MICEKDVRSEMGQITKIVLYFQSRCVIPRRFLLNDITGKVDGIVIIFDFQ